ncbi:BA75_05037T0 [Komagataella pastoris]|uniref:BA75_05037T0 n=1 Tax=Komagataella pastoris TaxID=4922 RepID=A0A1B2JIC0_PICPA|nr:BA75_05037T0 [Komagataella pastoris]
MAADQPEENTPKPKEKESSKDEVETKKANRKEGAPRRPRRQKVQVACVYCRRSHMICDDSRPCQRCIKRNIGHLCRDEQNSKRLKRKSSQEEEQSDSHQQTMSPMMQSSLSMSPPAVSGGSMSSQIPLPMSMSMQQQTNPQMNTSDPNVVVTGYNKPQPANSLNGSHTKLSTLNKQPFFFSEHAGSEFSSLNEFLSMIDDPDMINHINYNNDPILQNFDSTTNLVNHFNQEANNGNINTGNVQEISAETSAPPLEVAYDSSQVYPNFTYPQQQQQQAPAVKNSDEYNQPVISDTARDKFFLTAADPTTEISPEERLKQVINAKLEAGLLKPYNYAKGYARLQAYMDNYMNITSRQRILKPLSTFRPGFRAIAKTLKDIDLILVEEHFERMLLDYDRVFTSMAIPACLWRRTGEIYRGNKEFASLVEVSIDDLKNGKLTIYELMTEESSVNFWEKYGSIAFDKSQKAVLTSCNLRTKDGRKRKNCCFSFTIRRDKHNIPSCIVGNFIPISP